MHLRRTASIALAVLVAVVAPACTDDDGGEEGGGTATGDGAAAAATATVTMKDFEFDPATVDVDKGEVTFELANEGDAAHTFTTDAPKADEEVAGGEDGSVTVSLPNEGEVIFYCRFHRGQGMQGKIVIKG
ncbi:MAG TPA: cupredoxin domain-containing protein [Acidimicrobiales bacterium]